MSEQTVSQQVGPPAAQGWTLPGIITAVAIIGFIAAMFASIALAVVLSKVGTACTGTALTSSFSCDHEHQDTALELSIASAGITGSFIWMLMMLAVAKGLTLLERIARNESVQDSLAPLPQDS